MGNNNLPGSEFIENQLGYGLQPNGYQNCSQYYQQYLAALSGQQRAQNNFNVSGSIETVIRQLSGNNDMFRETGKTRVSITRQLQEEIRKFKRIIKFSAQEEVKI